MYVKFTFNYYWQSSTPIFVIIIAIIIMAGLTIVTYLRTCYFIVELLLHRLEILTAMNLVKDTTLILTALILMSKLCGSTTHFGVVHIIFGCYCRLCQS